MDDPSLNNLMVYSCIVGEEGKRRKSKRNLLNNNIDSINGTSCGLLLNSREFLGEVCNLNLPDIKFGVYQKNSNIEYDYEILILIDTYIIDEIETSNNKDIESLIPSNDNKIFNIPSTIYPEPDILSYSNERDQIKELILPFKTTIHDEVEHNDNVIIPRLRSRCIIIPIKLSDTWTLIWVKFTKLLKYVEIFQFSGLKESTDKLSYKSLEFIKLMLSDLLNLQNDDDLMFSFKYIPQNMNSNNDSNLFIVKTVQCIIKGYQSDGFNITPFSLPILRYDDVRNYVRHTRTRVLPLMELKEIREFNIKNTRKTEKAKANTRNSFTTNSINNSNNVENTNTNDIRKRHSTTLNSNSSSSSPSRLICNSVYKAPERRNTRIHPEKRNINSSPSPTSLISKDPKIIVNLDNISKIKNTINYDKEKMNELTQYYVQTYDDVEAFLLDKWSKVELFSKKQFSEDKCPFLIYGPSQIEYEIIKEGNIVATNTLKHKIKKFNVTLTTRTMRFLTSSRRWINQRFKFDKELKSVYYTRDPNLYIPDYRDTPYIVMATHLHYDCASADETFEITHKNWYISRKMVAFIVAKCEKCNSKS